jgi:heptosyltransferase III
LGTKWAARFDAGIPAKPLNSWILKILLMRGGALGDLLLTLPVLDAIRAKFAESFLEVWGIQPQAGLIQSADRIARLDAPDVAPLFISGPITPGLQRRLREFDIAISFLSDPDGVAGENLASAGVQRIITCSPMMRPGVHAVYQLAAALEPLGVGLHNPVPRLKLDGIQKHESLLGFHPGSGSRLKNWPLERWSELVEKIAPRFERLLLIAGEADREAVPFFQRRYGSFLEIMFCPNLWDLARALSRCTVFLGHDSGVTHLAAAVNTATIALFGPTDPGVWRPLGDQVEIIRGEGGRMDAISVSAVRHGVASIHYTITANG